MGSIYRSWTATGNISRLNKVLQPLGHWIPLRAGRCQRGEYLFPQPLGRCRPSHSGQLSFCCVEYSPHYWVEAGRIGGVCGRRGRCLWCWGGGHGSLGFDTTAKQVVLKRDLGVLGIGITGVCFVCLGCGDQRWGMRDRSVHDFGSS